MGTNIFLNLFSVQRGRVNDANQFNIHFVSKLKNCEITILATTIEVF
jgi:hypothetical protein